MLRKARLSSYAALLLSLLLSLLLAVGSAFAEDDDEDEEEDFARTGAYVAGSAKLALKSTPDGIALFPTRLESMSWQPDFGLDVRLGWRETPLFAVEAEFEWITDRDSIDFGFWSIGANAKIYALEERIQPYFLIGATGMWTKTRTSMGTRRDWGFRQGIGVDYYLTNDLAVTAESTFMWGVDDLWKYYYLTAGVGMLYRF